MNRKIKLLIATLIIVCVSLLAVGLISVKQHQPRIDFNRTHDQIIYDFAKAFADATEEMHGMTFENAAIYMMENDLEPYIQKMHEVMDTYILLLRKWEQESNTVCIDPFTDIRSMIAFEFAYQLSKSGINHENAKWPIFESTFISVAFSANHYPNTRDIIKGYLDKPSIIRSMAIDPILVDYDYAHIRWSELEKILNTFIDDSDIPDEKKKWAVNYLQSDPYGDLRRRLAESGLD